MTTATMTAQPVQKTVSATIKSVDTVSRTISFIATHERVDRTGEVVLVHGIDSTAFKENPVLLANHNPEKPVARVTSLLRQTVDGYPALVGKAWFTQDPDSDTAYLKVRNGLLNAVSIGFRSMQRGKPRFKEQSGVTHERTQLLEISLTSVPACESCLVTEKSMPPLPAQDEDTVTFETADLVAAMTEALKREVGRTLITKLTGRVY